MLAASSTTNFDTRDLRAIAGGFLLEDAIGASAQSYGDAVAAILLCLQTGEQLKPPSDPVWTDAATIGRALVVLDTFRLPDSRHISVAAAAKRLVDQGFAIPVNNGRVDRTAPFLTEVTSAITERLGRLGLVGSLGNRSICDEF